MAHMLILGMTQSGKTTLAKAICKAAINAGRPAIVYDPLLDTWAEPNKKMLFTCSDEHKFLKAFWDSKNCHVFIDESGSTVGRRNNVQMIKTATQGRHWGHKCHYIAQRASTIETTVRHQCTSLAVFAVAPSDAKILAEEWNDSDLLEASLLQKGEYLLKTGRFAGAKLMRAW